MYNVTVNRQTLSVSSFAAAVSAVKGVAVQLQQRLQEVSAKPAPVNLYRSPKVAHSVRATQAAQAANVARVTLPKLAGTYTGKAGVLRWKIARD